MTAIPDPTSVDAEIVCVGHGGRRLRVFAPVLGTLCSRCGLRADDVCFLLEAVDGTTASGGLCGPCAIDLADAALGPG